MEELLELRGVVEASPEAVAEIMLDVRPGGRSPLATSGTAEPAKGDVFTVTQDGGRLTVAVDRDAFSVSVHSEWWYQAITTVVPDERGALVVHRVFNVAPGHRWAVRFASRGPLNAAPANFAVQLAELGTELGVKAYPLN
jgi:hypothetical protein